MKAFAENPRAVQTILGGRRVAIFGIESPEGISLLGILYYFTYTGVVLNICIPSRKARSNTRCHRDKKIPFDLHGYWHFQPEVFKKQEIDAVGPLP